EVGYHNTLTAAAAGAAGPAPASTPMAAGASRPDRLAPLPWRTPLSANAADPPCPTVATVAVAINSTSNPIIRFILTSHGLDTDTFVRSGLVARHIAPVHRWIRRRVTGGPAPILLGCRRAVWLQGSAVFRDRRLVWPPCVAGE